MLRYDNRRDSQCLDDGLGGTDILVEWESLEAGTQELVD